MAKILIQYWLRGWISPLPLLALMPHSNASICHSKIHKFTLIAAVIFSLLLPNPLHTIDDTIDRTQDLSRVLLSASLPLPKLRVIKALKCPVKIMFINIQLFSD